MTNRYPSVCPLRQPVDDNILEVKDFEKFLTNRIKVGTCGSQKNTKETQRLHTISLLDMYGIYAKYDTYTKSRM